MNMDIVYKSNQLYDALHPVSLTYNDTTVTVTPRQLYSAVEQLHTQNQMDFYSLYWDYISVNNPLTITVHNITFSNAMHVPGIIELTMLLDKPKYSYTEMMNITYIIHKQNRDTMTNNVFRMLAQGKSRNFIMSATGVKIMTYYKIRKQFLTTNQQ